MERSGHTDKELEAAVDSERMSWICERVDRDECLYGIDLPGVERLEPLERG